MKHKQYNEIVAWADGAEIEVKSNKPKYLYVYEDSFYDVDEKASRASTRIMNKRVREFEANYIGKIPLIVESNDGR